MIRNFEDFTSFDVFKYFNDLKKSQKIQNQNESTAKKISKESFMKFYRT